eukprot:gb/GFBE01025544.1/.p1 GENE.gb/GFBE01025544.1/~~gb/GFBE01025544.1/.p1  ORF type:complete len:621 (+),score=153.82 gb/GFBE01025544.1/:1-1863(+)
MEIGCLPSSSKFSPLSNFFVGCGMLSAMPATPASPAGNGDRPCPSVSSRRLQAVNMPEAAIDEEDLLQAPSAEFLGLLSDLSKQYLKELSAARAMIKDLQSQNKNLRTSKGGKTDSTSAPSSEDTQQDDAVDVIAGSTSAAVQREGVDGMRRLVSDGLYSNVADEGSVSDACKPESLDDMHDYHGHSDHYTSVTLAKEAAKEVAVGALAEKAESVLKGEVEAVKVLTPWDKVKQFSQSSMADGIIAILLLLNVIIMAVDLQLSGWRAGYSMNFYDAKVPVDRDWPSIQNGFYVAEIVFTVIFLVEVVLRMITLRLSFWNVAMNWVDLIATFLSVLDVCLSVVEAPVNPIFFRLLRLGRLARAFRIFALSANMECLSLLLKCCLSGVSVLGWATLLLIFLQGIAGMVMCTLVQDYLNDETQDQEAQRKVFAYWGTSWRTFLTMFEILFANWAPSCRVLVDNVNEWFALAFLVYRCAIGVALINVVNSVFISQTLSLAQNDEAFLMKKAEKEQMNYKKKLEALFMNADSSGDGLLSMAEFMDLLENPQLRLWLSQVQLEHHQFLELFSLVDDGDGHVDYKEFVEGATRLKGNAKALDVFRLETKVDLALRKLNDFNHFKVRR